MPAPVPYANLTNPQTLNLYAMVSDNPETFADLDGHLIGNGGPYNLETADFSEGGPLAGNCDYMGGDCSQKLFDDENSGIPSWYLSEVSNGNDQDKAQQQKTGPPVKVIRTGKRVYKKPTKINGVKFEGTRYTYKVVNAKGNIVRGAMTVTESLTGTSQTQQLPTPATWSTSNGQFADYVGYAETGGFPQNFRNVVDQTFIVTQNGVSTRLSTTIRQTVSTDANGNVTGVSHTIIP